MSRERGGVGFLGTCMDSRRAAAEVAITGSCIPECRHQNLRKDASTREMAVIEETAMLQQWC